MKRLAPALVLALVLAALLAGWKWNVAPQPRRHTDAPLGWTWTGGDAPPPSVDGWTWTGGD